MRKPEPDTNVRILPHTLFLRKEYGMPHLAYEKELAFYDAVRRGDFDTLNKIMLPLRDERLGKLSPDPLRNARYHLIVTVALITRFCMEGGLDPETAYTLSDLYIQQIDACRDTDSIDVLHRELVFDFADRMKKLQTAPGLSRAVKRAVDYIYDNLPEKLTLDDIAREAGTQKNYLCALFKKETGMTVGHYIMRQKIEATKNMLAYADYPPETISAYFSFSSHSHFIRVFKKSVGMTPAEYRRRTFRSHWSPALS